MSMPDKWQESIAWASEFSGEPQWNVLKLDPENENLSLLFYTNYFLDPFPALATSYHINLTTGSVSARHYNLEENRPVLHRKELLLLPMHPERDKFAALTEALERAGLLLDAHRIGYHQQWQERLSARGYIVRDHELICVSPEKASNTSSGHWFVQRHRTAISRSNFSAPMQALERHNYLDGSRAVFDYGCGKGNDIHSLKDNGVPAFGWDPHFRSDAEKSPAPIVNLGFVINVIETREERIEVLRDAFSYAEEILVVSVMLAAHVEDTWHPFGDGVITRRGTFQKYFSQEEIAVFIEFSLGISPVAVAPGVFFVFREESDAQNFIERRAASWSNTRRLLQKIPSVTREERNQILYEKNKQLIDDLWERYLELGRRPRVDEIEEVHLIESTFGSLRKALNFIERYHGGAYLQEAAITRKENLTVLLAMKLFGKRSALQAVLTHLGQDLREFFGSRSQAIEEARLLLFSLGDAELMQGLCESIASQGIGKLEQDKALVLHHSQIDQLPAALRAYVGCATHLYGDVSAADLIKIHIESGKLSLMRYDDFEGSVLPKMLERVKINFRQQSIDVFRYGDEFPAPFLYLKSQYIPENFNNFALQKDFDKKLIDLIAFDFSHYGPSNEKFLQELNKRRLRVHNFEIVDAIDIPNLDEPCGKYHVFRDLIQCGVTQQLTGIPNIPKQPKSYNALYALADKVLDPVMDYFGGVKLTYGFCSRELGKAIFTGVAPKLDQHACHEISLKGNLICPRGGAAVDFIIQDESMLEVARWISDNTEFDRLYYYGDRRSVHVSVGLENKRQIVLIKSTANRSRLPQVVKDLKSISIKW